MSHNLAPLATLSQIALTPSREDGIPADLEDDLRTHGCQIIQEAGRLLKLPQVAMATAQVLFQRFFFVSSLKQFGIKDTGMGALYLATKLEECPVRLRDLINAYDLLHHRTLYLISSSSSSTTPKFSYTPMTYFSSTFYDMKDALVVAEMQILKRLGFNVQIQLPYATLINYLQALGMTNREGVVNKAWGYLNDALQTPVYALYASSTLATAVIHLTLSTLSIPVPQNWWVLFDSDLDDILSICGYIMGLYDRLESGRGKRVWAWNGKKDVRTWLEEEAKGK